MNFHLESPEFYTDNMCVLQGWGNYRTKVTDFDYLRILYLPDKCKLITTSLPTN